MSRLEDKYRRRLRRKFSIRKRIRGTAERPRVTIYKSNRYTYLQAIDDAAGKTVAAASNKEKDLSSVRNTVAEIGKLGEAFGRRLAEKQIKRAVFDRNGYLFHGKVRAVADAIRKAGVQV
jgi:large subunit ribosomal protein L18